MKMINLELPVGGKLPAAVTDKLHEKSCEADINQKAWI